MAMAAFKPATGGTGSTTMYIIHADHLGGTNVVSDGSGNVTQALDYYPYGSRRINSGTDVSQREFIGEMFDESSSLSYLNARYYNGSRGQFLSEDPVHLALGDAAQVKGYTGLPQHAYLADPQLLNSYGAGCKL
jgi:RHS repeat-associated protein